MPRAIPDRWIPYKAYGSVIEGTRLICFKVPLKKAVQKNNTEIKEIWDIPALLRSIPQLSAVIDITNTDRYYNRMDLEKVGVRHKKINLPGRVIPPDDKVSEFMDAVDEFLGKDGDSLIGVHCTHGLNRTGYMVCRYLRDRLGMNAKEAIKKFEIARGYKIERDNFIADLLGEAPPPPYEGNRTKIKPLMPPRECKDSYKYDGTSWRDQCKYNPGYVRHPDYNYTHSSSNNGSRQASSRGYHKTRSNSDSDRSDASYDFRHDY